MIIKSQLLSLLHLDPDHNLLIVRGSRILLEMFRLLDIHDRGSLNDVVFSEYMRCVTDMTQSEIRASFEVLDIDNSGEIEFDEFYLLNCILVAAKENRQKEFAFHHCRTVFDLLDADSSGTVSCREFRRIGFLFGFYSDAIQSIFKDFDVSGDEELDFTEFKLLTMACIDEQKERDISTMKKARKKQFLNFAASFKPIFNNYNENKTLPAEDRLTVMQIIEKSLPSIDKAKGLENVKSLFDDPYQTERQQEGGFFQKLSFYPPFKWFKKKTPVADWRDQ